MRKGNKCDELQATSVESERVTRKKSASWARDANAQIMPMRYFKWHMLLHSEEKHFVETRDYNINTKKKSLFFAHNCKETPEQELS